MIHIWNIYETGDSDCPGPDPFDIFLYTIRREEEPYYNDSLFVEGRLCRIIAVLEDKSRTEMLALESTEKYWKVCVK